MSVVTVRYPMRRRRAAGKASADAVSHWDVTEREIYDCLSESAEVTRIDEIYPSGIGAMTAVFVAASLLRTFCPEDMCWPEYLNQILDDFESVGGFPAYLLQPGRT